MKKVKRLLSIFLAAVMVFGLVQVGFAAVSPNANTIKVATLSDIRYQAGARDADGLLISKSAELLDAAVEKIMQGNADVLLVTGDLTNTGNRTSHEYVAGKLAQIQAQGIKVFVIPGEHDVREGGSSTAVSKSVFEDIYKDFGYSESRQDASSASYVADLGNGFKVVMSDSVTEDGKGQITQWAVNQARSEIAAGNTVIAASHHPAVSRGSIDKVFIDLLNTLAGVEIDLGGKTRLYTNDPAAAAVSLGLSDDTRILADNGTSAADLADAGVKFLFTGHGGTLSIEELTTQAGSQMYDIMTGSLVNAASGVRITTITRSFDAMKTQRVDLSTQMITSAQGVEDVEAAAHAALEKYMPTQVDYAIEKAEAVIAHVVPAIRPNVISLVKNLDLAALVPDMAGLFNVLGGTIQNVKNDLADRYVGPLLDIIGNGTKIHNILADVRAALEAMDFNGQSFYAFLTDIFVSIQKGDGETPASVEAFFSALRNKEPELLVGIIESFADNFQPSNLVSWINEILDLSFQGTYLGTLRINVQLRGLLAGPYNLTSGLYTYTLDLWGILDGEVSLPNGKLLSTVARPLVNDLILGAENSASAKQTPERFTQNLKKNAPGIVDLLFEFGVGDLIGTDIFPQAQSGSYVARSVTLDELGAALDRLIPDSTVTALNAADWPYVRDAINSAGRFGAEQLSSVNAVLVAATDTTAEVTQLSLLRELVNDSFGTAVAQSFTAGVNALPALEALTLDNAARVRELMNDYDTFFSQIKPKVSAETAAAIKAAYERIIELENYDEAVADVIAKIDAIGTVTVDSQGDIDAALAAYNALTVRQQNNVSNYQTLLDAQAALAAAKENAAAIKTVEDAISAIGEVTYTSASRVRITAARAAYDALADALKPGVGNLAVLEAAEAEYARLRADSENQAAAAPVITQIEAIGTVTLESRRLIEAAESAYAALTDAQKAYVTNYDVLTAARAAYNALVEHEQGNRAAAQAVMDKINAIGVVTLESEAAINEAADAYNLLTPTQKALVTNIAVLTNAQTTLAQLKKQAADGQAAAAVEALIAAIGEVTLEKEAQIAQAREAYNALTSDQKRLVGNLALLTAAEAQLSVLKNDFFFEDGATGITLRAASGVLPLDTVMQVETIVDGDAFDAVSALGGRTFKLYNIALISGEQAVAPSQAVRISIPKWGANTAVYAVAANGSATPVEATVENGSFNFSYPSVGMFAVVQASVKVDYTALTAAMTAYEALNMQLFTAKSAAAAQAAYEAAQAELNAAYALTSANQRKVDAATAALNDAIAALEYLPANTTALRTALYKAKALNAADYKAFSAVEAAISAAESFLASNSDIRDSQTIATLEQNLNAAMAALEFAPADFTAINNALAKVPSNTQAYTAESVAVLTAAVEAANTVKSTVTREDPDWQEKVDKAAADVLSAIAGLTRANVTYADVKKLERAIKIAALYKPSDYSNYDAVEQAVEAARLLLETRPESSAQAQVDAAEKAILSAVSSLEFAGSTSFLRRMTSTFVTTVRRIGLLF